MGEWRIGSSEWRVANGEWEERYPHLHFFLSPFSLLTIRYSPFLFATHYSLPFIQHSATDQRFHVLDVVPANLVGDGTDAGGARHRVTAEKQVIAGADQAGVEQHRIDLAEFAAPDAFGQQAAMKIEQGCDKEFRDLVGGLRV